MMINFDHLYTLLSIFEDGQKKKEYDDLNNEINSLKIKVLSKQEITESDDKEFFRIIQDQRKRIIVDKCTELRNKIEKRKTKGQHFSSILRDINKIRREGEKGLPIDKYDDLIVDLINFEKEIDEKISIEKHQFFQSWKMLVRGLIAGFILGIAGRLLIK